MAQMFTHNWPYKLLALASAIMLFVYVRGQQNVVHSTQFLPIPVLAPAGQRVVEPAPGTQVRVDLDGPAEAIRKLDSEEIKVTVDTSEVKPGQAARQQIMVEIPDKYRKQGVDVHWRPQSVTVKIIADATRQLPVVVKAVAHPDGWQLREAPTAGPERATISGLQTDVDRVATVVAPFSPDGTPRISVVSTLQAVDGEGQTVPQVRIEPPQVLISGVQERVVLQKRVPVQPVFRVAPGSKVNVTVIPPRVHLIGPERVLADVYVLETEPIDVPAGQTSVSVNAALTSPGEGVQVAPDHVKVTIRVQGPGARPVSPRP